MTVERQTVQSEAPRSTIDQQDAIDTRTVEVSGVRETVTRRAGLALPQTGAVKEPTVRVTIESDREERMRQQTYGVGG